MKKLLAILLAMTMVMALVACGGNKDNSAPPADNQQSEPQAPADPAPASGGEITLWTYPIGDWGKEDKVKAIQFLSQNGAFLITKSGDKVAKYFGISKYTLYSYIDMNKQEGN